MIFTFITFSILVSLLLITFNLSVEQSEFPLLFAQSNLTSIPETIQDVQKILQGYNNKMIDILTNNSGQSDKLLEYDGTPVNVTSNNKTRLYEMEFAIPANGTRFESNGGYFFLLNNNNTGEKTVLITTVEYDLDFDDFVSKFIDLSNNLYDKFDVKDFQKYNLKGRAVVEIKSKFYVNSTMYDGMFTFVNDDIIYNIGYFKVSEEKSNMSQFDNINTKIFDNFIRSVSFDDKKSPVISMNGIDLPYDPDKIALNWKTNILYVASKYSKMIFEIDTNENRIIKNFTVREPIENLFLDSINNLLYLKFFSTGVLELINLDELDKEYYNSNYVDVSYDIINLAFDDTDQNNLSNLIFLLTNNQTEPLIIIEGSTQTEIKLNNSEKIDLSNAIKSLPKVFDNLSIIPKDIAVNPLLNKLYLTFYNSKSILKLDYYSGENSQFKINQITNITTDISPIADIEVDQNNGNLYAISVFEGTSVFFLNGTSNKIDKLRNITPTMIELNQNTGNIVLTDIQNNSISLINGSNFDLIQSRELGNKPKVFIINPNSNEIYLINHNSKMLEVIDGQNMNSKLSLLMAIYPPNSGRLSCDINGSPFTLTNKEYYSFVQNSLVGCQALPNDGFGFAGWKFGNQGISNRVNNDESEMRNIDSNSFSQSGSTSKVEVTEYAQMTANFEPVKPILSYSDLVNLFLIIVVPVITSVFIPKIYDHIQERLKTRKVINLYEEIKRDPEDNENNTRINEYYVKGIINESQKNALEEAQKSLKDSIEL